MFRKIAIAAIVAAAMTSCSKSDEVANSRLTFASQVINGPQTRATSGGTFDLGDQVSIYIEKVVSGNAGVSGTYTFDSDGSSPTATFSTSALYWNDFAGGINATAWYPKENTYAYQTDQHAGIQSSDFLFAKKVEGITRENWGSSPLTFEHKTAKVTVALVKGTGVQSIDGATVKINGFTTVDNIVKSGINATGAITPTAARGWITPDASKTALLLPGQLTGDIFEVTLAGAEAGQKYTYNGSYTFEAGKAYTFTVTVKKTGLEVKGSIKGWEDGGSPAGPAE